MPGSDDLPELLDELASVMRARLSPAVLRRHPRLVERLTSGLALTDPLSTALTRVKVSILGLPGVVGEAAQAMVGLSPLHPRTAAPRATREVIKNTLAQILERRTGSVQLSTRRVEQLERQLLAPYVALALGLIERVEVPPSWILDLEKVPSSDAESDTASHDVRSLPIFVQYCNPELVRVSGLGDVLDDYRSMMRLLRTATRLALLLTDDAIIFPASYLYEVPGFTSFLSEAGPVRECGLLAFISPSSDLSAFREMKRDEYRDDTENPYSSNPLPRGGLPGLIWRPRGQTSTASHIAGEWRSQLEGSTGQLVQAVRAASQRGIVTERDAINELLAVPGRLDGKAFIGRFARATTSITFSPLESALIETFLSYSYLRSYLGDLNASILTDFPFGDLSCGIAFDGTDRTYRALAVHPLLTRFSRLGLMAYLFDEATWSDFMTIRNLPELPYVIDHLAYGNLAEATERALARTRHGVGHVRSVTAIQAQLQQLLRAMHAS
jgi:hypothetical protein